MSEWIDGRMDEWMNAQANGCMDGCISCSTPFPFPFYPLHPLDPPLNHHPLQPSPHNHPSTPSLRPFKYHSLTGASLPPPAPLQTPGTNTIYTKMYVLQMCEGHPTSLHFTPPSTSLHSTAVPYHSISSRSTPIHTIPPHFSRVRPTQSHPSLHASGHACWPRQAGRRESKQICNHQYTQTRRQPGNGASRQADEHAGGQAGKWVNPM